MCVYHSSVNFTVLYSYFFTDDDKKLICCDLHRARLSMIQESCDNLFGNSAVSADGCEDARTDDLILTMWEESLLLIKLQQQHLPSCCGPADSRLSSCGSYRTNVDSFYTPRILLHTFTLKTNSIKMLN